MGVGWGVTTYVSHQGYQAYDVYTSLYSSMCRQHNTIFALCFLAPHVVHIPLCRMQHTRDTLYIVALFSLPLVSPYNGPALIFLKIKAALCPQSMYSKEMTETLFDIQVAHSWTQYLDIQVVHSEV